MPDPTSQCLELHTLGKGEIPLDAQGGRQDIAVRPDAMARRLKHGAAC